VFYRIIGIIFIVSAFVMFIRRNHLAPKNYYENTEYGNLKPLLMFRNYILIIIVLSLGIAFTFGLIWK